jgi:hypothetical protein
MRCSILVGIDPLSTFPWRSKAESISSFEIEVEIGPVNLLSSSRRTVRRVSSKMFSGIGPSKALLLRPSPWSRVSLDNSGGIWPEKLFPESTKKKS